MSVHLHHLTGDNSWLLTFRSDSSGSENHSKSLTFLLDPWFTEPDVQVHRLWLRQLHSTTKPPQFKDFRALKGFLAAENRQVDGIIITFNQSDHLHKPTIDGVDEEIPFFAFRRAARTLKQWGRKHVYEIPREPNELRVCEGILEAEERAGRSSTRRDLIDKLDIRLGFVPTTARLWKDPVQDLMHGSLVIMFSRGTWRGAIVYSPHGTPLKDMARWKKRKEKEMASDSDESPNGILEVLAFMAGWDVARMPQLLGGTITFGTPKNARVTGLLSPRYWIRTHEELTLMSGFVSAILKRDVWSKDKVEGEIQGHRTKVLEMDPGETLTIAMTEDSA
ncbi:hypothetical protein AAF712_012972 [Marasmius tenuissimus]|uniref:Uncharacterized protein n=1 Tax=Marasmius tenuissimus TaxID=585030 RepID=A0ABR2ZG57_9AGAR|nr:hypothetical protein PM082_007319 [Marasmius tenuissimus]